MLPTDVDFLIRQEQYKDLLREAAQERLILTVEPLAITELWQTVGAWVRQRIMPRLVIPTFHFYSR